MIVKHLAGLAEFSSQKMAKTTIARGETMFAGLNCFEPGQEHAAHAHAGQDKLYVVLEGDAEIQVGDDTQLVSAGGGAFAPAGVDALRAQSRRKAVGGVSGARSAAGAISDQPPHCSFSRRTSKNPTPLARINCTVCSDRRQITRSPLCSCSPTWPSTVR